MSTATKARTEDAATMAQVLQRQKAANIREGAPGAETRIDRIDRCIKLLIGHETQIVKALNEDFGNRGGRGQRHHRRRRLDRPAETRQGATSGPG